jgi:uncharacterized coiled-coil protein SlyX
MIREHIASVKSSQLANESLEKCLAERTENLHHTQEQLRQLTDKYQNIFINAFIPDIWSGG